MVAKSTNSQSSAAGAAPAWNAGIGGVPAGFQQIPATTLANATKLTLPSGGATLALITVEGSGATVRYRDDGTAPDGTHGILIPSGVWPPFVYSADLTALQFIAGAGSPILNVAFYK